MQFVTGPHACEFARRMYVQKINTACVVKGYKGY